MKLILLPGWHESGDHMNTFADGRAGKPGFNQLGYDCAIFPQGTDALRPRIDRFAAFLDELKVRQPHAFPVATLGYSAGGLVNRGFLRAYPERAGELFATIQVGTPNGGLIANYVGNTLRMLRAPDPVIGDIDVASDFMRWLNGTSGHWVDTGRKDKKKTWRLDTTPEVAPAATRIFQIAGRVPKYVLESDGVVMVDSATLEGAVPTTFIDDPRANHLNLGAVFNLGALLLRGFVADDTMWTRVVEIADRFITQESGYERGTRSTAQQRHDL
jgi:pimeloyl-ACP methyl ester carboxylesterase